MASDGADNPQTNRLKLFVSYARADSGIANKVVAALQSSGFEVWWDALIEGGATFAKSIESALEAADAVIVLWSQTSINSDWVRDEAGQGRDRHRLVPVSLDGTDPPLGFRQYHATDLRGWQGHGDEPQYVALLKGIASATEQAVTLPERVRARRQGVGRRGVIAGGIGATALIAGGGGVIAWRAGLLGKAIDADSIAVLPFRNLSGDPGQTYFSDGLTEEVRSALARNNSLQVLASTSSETERDHKDDARIVAKKLGVAYLLEGSVRRAGDLVRITAELTDGKTGFGKWSNSFDRKLADIFAVQTEIAKTVVDALAIRMATAAPAPGGTTNPVAYEAFLKGRAMFYNSHDEATDRAALAQFDAAIAADPNYAAAYAARSRSLAAIASQYAKVSDLKRLNDAATADAKHSVELAPNLADGYLALGHAITNGQLDVAAARASYDKAYALGRGDANLIVLYAIYCSRAGRAADARAAIARALMLDPLNPRAFRTAGIIEFYARRYSEAIARNKQSLAMKPGIANANFYVGASLYLTGHADQARAAFEIEPLPLLKFTGLAIAEQKLGNSKGAEAAMRQLIDRLGDNGLYQQAQILAQWGQIDSALAKLERARTVNDSGLLLLGTDPFVDPLRTSARFVAVMKTLHFA